MEMAHRGMQDREALVADAVRFITANYEQTKQAGKNNGLISDSDGRSACAQPAANAILGELPQ